MATFNIKRGDSMPPLIISMRIAGTDPDEFYDFNKDDVGGVSEANAGSPSTVTKVNFIMTNIETGEIVGRQSNVSNRITGTGVIYEKIVPDQFEDEAQTIPKKKTLIRYNWAQPDDNYDPKNIVAGVFGGDTAKAGTYKAEFEVFYSGAGGGGGGSQALKRTFPATPGDVIIINVLPDDNDKQSGEAV